MKYATLCSGIEACSAAWHPMGFEPVFFSEIEPFPKAVLKHHYPNVPDYGDMTKYKDWPNEQSIDLICAGTPCQSFSVAGLRQGLQDPRGNLTLTFLGVLERYRPRWVVWENVPGVLSDRTNAFGNFLGGLAQLGYGFAYRVLDAQYFGVAQRRRRVFVVGYFGDWQPAAAVLFESDCLRRDSPPSRKKGEGVAGYAESSIGGYRKDQIGGTLKASGGVLGGGSETFVSSNDRVTPTLDAHYGEKMGQDNQHINNGAGLFVLNDQGGSVMNIETDNISPTLRRETHGHEPIIFEPRSPDGVPRIHDNISPTLNTMSGGQREPCVSYSIQGNIIDRSDTAGANGKGVKEEQAFTLNTIDRQAVAHTFKIRGGCDGGGKGYLGQDEAAFTLDTTQSQNLMHQTAIRRLTPIECERLQGFPDNYTQIPFRNKPPHQCPDGPRYKALGNSMAVPVMAWIGRRIQEIDKYINQ
jgi:DNA (cytosine-5)-methyltransferase 1